MKLPVLFALAASVLTVSAHSQSKDYMITNLGDTIHCKITQAFNYSYKYRTSDTVKAKSINIKEVQEFYKAKGDILMRRVYSSGVKDSVGGYLRLIQRGNICLYEQVVHGNTEVTNWFVSKGSDTVTIIKTSYAWGVRSKSRKDRKNEFANMLIDKKEVYDKFIRDDKLGFDDIQNIVHLYNTGTEIPKKQEDF